MLCLILTGAFFYVILLKSVKRKIARLERSLQETEETRQKMTTMSARREEMKREFAQYGADRPVSLEVVLGTNPEAGLCSSPISLSLPTCPSATPLSLTLS